MCQNSMSNLLFLQHRDQLPKLVLSDTDCEIVGVEIMEGAKLIETHPFKGPTAFILGNEVRKCLILSQAPFSYK